MRRTRGKETVWYLYLYNILDQNFIWEEIGKKCERNHMGLVLKVAAFKYFCVWWWCCFKLFFSCQDLFLFDALILKDEYSGDYVFALCILSFSILVQYFLLCSTKKKCLKIWKEKFNVHNHTLHCLLHRYHHF